jgi:5-methylcytosine-specific restriction endonuclease McrA
MSVRRRKYREKAGFILSRKIDFFTRERESRGHHKNSLGRITKILNNKICNFVREGDTMSRSFSVDDLLKRVGDNPICYLTGEKIDLSKSSTYQLDHIVPRTLGGDNSLENLGLCISKANMAKTDMPLEEFFSLCRRILENNGYAVSKKEST